MKQLANILVFVILYLKCTNSELFKQKTVYAYNGKILMKNVASNKLASIWTISGKLSVENLTDYLTFKLDDVKTRVFNGDPKTLNSIDEIKIPGISKMIQEPFVVYPGNKSGYNITHKPDEVVWSLNMKRSIANIFFLNTDKKYDSVSEETTIYGDCKVKYNIINYGALTIRKTIDRRYCRNSPNFDVFNAGSKIFNSTKSETKRIYYFNGPESLLNIETTSFTTYESIFNVRSKPIIQESQQFIQTSHTTTFNPINIAELTSTSSIILDLSTRKKTEADKLNSNELIKYFTDNYKKFKDYLKKYPLMNTNGFENKNVFKMFDAIKRMDKNTLFKLEKKIRTTDDNLLPHLFVSYLPYIGTNESLYYIKDLVTQDLNDVLAIRILATLPFYNNDINSELLQELEVLMNLKKMVNNPVRDAGILCFASIVSTARYELTGKEIAKYVGIYRKNFEDAINYETKMVWLLGLINMATVLKTKDILALISNFDESRHIRVLAAYGFKHHLISEASSEIHDNMWPIIKNSSEPFEVRAACLDIIFYPRLTKNEFDNIVNLYQEKLLEPNEEHLTKYIYTLLQALQFKDYATEIEQILKLPSNRAWSTGCYYMAYTDNDLRYGTSIQAALISNPITNILNSAFVTVEDSVHSLNTEYSVYIKAEGLAELYFSHAVLKNKKEYTVPKLLELFKKNAYKLKQNHNIHIDIVIFCRERVLFNLHINKENIENYATNPFYLDILSLITDYNSLSFPIYEYNTFVSDLGTPLFISTDIVEIVSLEMQNDYLKDLLNCDLKYRRTLFYSLSMESLNPLVDANIATFKYTGEEVRVHVPYTFKLKSMKFLWRHEEDAFNFIIDHLIGTMVDKEKVLHEYCQNCDHVALINQNIWENYLTKDSYLWDSMFWDLIGITLNITYTKYSPEEILLDSMEPRITNLLPDVMDQHKTRTLVNIAKPFLFFSYCITYNRYVANDLLRYNIRSIPFYNVPTESILKLTFNKEDTPNDANPIINNDMNVSITLATQNSAAETLCHGNFTFRYFSASESSNSDALPLIHHKYKVNLTLINEIKSTFKLGIKRDVQYPSRRTDKFSLDPVDHANAFTTLMFGNNVNITSECLNNGLFYIWEIYSTRDNQKEIMLTSNEYKNCKEQSKGLKYTPPTNDCLASHEIISKYKTCDIYGQLLSPIQNVSQTKNGILYADFFRYEQFNDTHDKLSLLDVVILKYFNKRPKMLEQSLDLLYFQPSMSINPRVIAYDDHDLEWGFSRACYITPNRIRTFTGLTIKNYDEKSAGNSVAFVECLNMITAGMTIQKYGDKYVGFHLYTYNDTFVVSVPNADGKLKIQFNNETITKTNKSVLKKFYFLDDDAALLSTDVADIYFTGEYISLKVSSIYIRYICGLCA